MSDKYDDCESCAFGGQDHAICDSCNDSDQWEPGYEDDEGSAEITKINVIKIIKKPKQELEREKVAA